MPALIGRESAIRDEVALLFADRLHRGLARGERVGDAFDAARLPRAGEPRMIVDVDPHDLM